MAKKRQKFKEFGNNIGKKIINISTAEFIGIIVKKENS